MWNDGVPTSKFNWNDGSGASSTVLYSPPTEGLCVPFGFVLAERGVPGKLYYGGAKEIYAALGSNSFNESSKYFTPVSRFMGDAMSGQGVYLMRLVDPNATVATVGIFLEVIESDVIQYQKTVGGDLILDGDGDPLPQLDGQSNPIEEPGVLLKWVVKQIDGDDSFDALEPVVVTGGPSGTVTTYPIIAGEMAWVGEAGNRQGMSLYSTGTTLSTLAADLKSVVYRFAPKTLPTNVSTTASAIPDQFGQPFSDISFKDVAVYSKTATNYAAEYVIGTNYVDDADEYTLPYNLKFYGENIELIGNMILDYSPELTDTDPFMLDLIAGTDIEGKYLDHVSVAPSSSDVVNSNVVHYAKGGTDGTVSFAKLQELIRDFCEGTDHGELPNNIQHPLTHFYDPGFTMATKYSIYNLLDIRDDIKIDISTHDVSLPPNTAAQDLSAGQALFFQTQLHPNSSIAGVGCSRVSIFSQVGVLTAGSPYSGKIPLNYNRMIQRRNNDGGLYIKGSSGGMPNSEITALKKISWTGDNESLKKLFWASAINVASHATRTQLHHASLRTVYPNDTSLLSDDEIADQMIYLMKIARRKWAKYAGVKEPSEEFFPAIQKDIDDECAFTFNKVGISVTSRIFRTAADANLGYVTSVDPDVSGNFPQRQFTWNLNLTRASA